METEIFTCKYFKFGRNTTGLSQSHLRNFLACSISQVVLAFQLVLAYDLLKDRCTIDIFPSLFLNQND